MPGEQVLAEALRDLLELVEHNEALEHVTYVGDRELPSSWAAKLHALIDATGLPRRAPQWEQGRQQCVRVSRARATPASR